MSAPDETTSHFGLGPTRDDELARGTEIAGGRFTIQALRGAGGMAMVYLARDRERGMDVAFKLIGAKYAGKPGAEQRLRNEGTFAERIGAHPNVARPLEHGRLEDGRMYLVTEFVRGPSLADLLAMERRLSTTRACRLARDIAAGLAAIHERGVVHRDVKPDNVIVAHDGDHDVAKLVDFGLAGEIEPVGERLTAVHERPGTRLYMAPEQLAGARNAPGFDVYALGVTMYEMLCGFAPNESRAAADMIARKLEPATSVAEHRPDLPAALVSLVDRCMHPDPSKRVATASEVVAGLDEVLAELGFASDPGPPAGMFVPRVVSTISTTAETIEVTRRSSRAWMWIAAGAFVIAVVWIGRMQGWWLAERARETPVADAEPVREAKADEVVVAAPVAAPEPVVAAPVVAAPEPVAAPDPVPVAEPVADPPGEDPKSDPAVTPRKPKVTPAVPKVPKHETAECAETRARAEKAAKSRDWRGVISHSAAKECWMDKTERLRLILRARDGLGEYARCIEEGGTSTDPKIVSIVKHCRDNVGSP